MCLNICDPAIVYSVLTCICCVRSSDKTAIIWDLYLGRPLRTRCGHESDVVALCTSAAAAAAAGRPVSGGGAPLVISGSWDGTLRVWAPDSGDCLRVVRAHLADSNGGRYRLSVASLAAVGSGVVAGFVGGLVRVFDVWSGLAPEHEFRHASCGCVQVCYSPTAPCKMTSCQVSLVLQNDFLSSIPG